MARQIIRQFHGIVAGLVLVMAAGCQSNKSVVQDLPAPNFNGPTIVSPRTVAQAPVQPAPSPMASAPRSSIAGFGDRAWVPPVPARPWKWIVIHHSATAAGSAAEFDRIHREKGWDELGYHFVIGNGTGSGNGQVEVGPRWPKQKWGAHAKTPDNRFNDYGIGICLVGNFDIERPTQRQLDSLAQLVAYLQATYHIPSDHIIGHGNVHTIANGGTVTDCPGRNMNVAQVRSMAGHILAQHGLPEDPVQTAGANDLLGSTAARH